MNKGGLGAAANRRLGRAPSCEISRDVKRARPNISRAVFVLLGLGRVMWRTRASGAAASTQPTVLRDAGYAGYGCTQASSGLIETRLLPEQFRLVISWRVAAFDRIRSICVDVTELVLLLQTCFWLCIRPTLPIVPLRSIQNSGAVVKGLDLELQFQGPARVLRHQSPISRQIFVRLKRQPPPAQLRSTQHEKS